jgi:hypothetical protein
MATLKTLLKRRDDLADAMFDLAEQNFDEMQANMAANDDSGPSKAAKKRSKKLDRMRVIRKKLEAQIKELKKKRTFSGRGGGGAMTDLSQRTGATAKGSLFKKRMN